MTLEEAIYERHSVRSYVEEPLAAELTTELKCEIEKVNKESRLEIKLVTDEPKAFKGYKSYGAFHGVENYIVVAGKKSADLDYRAGYYGERLVLFAQTLGLNTCWVGLTYGKSTAARFMEDSSKIVAVISIGYGKTQGSRHKIKTVEQVSNASDATPQWFRSGVEAALLAPTAVNQQKFRFEYIGETADGKGLIRAKRGFSLIGYTKLDLGIACLHFELGAGKDNFEWSRE